MHSIDSLHLHCLMHIFTHISDISHPLFLFILFIFLLYIYCVLYCSSMYIIYYFHIMYSTFSYVIYKSNWNAAIFTGIPSDSEFGNAPDVHPGESGWWWWESSIRAGHNRRLRVKPVPARVLLITCLSLRSNRHYISMYTVSNLSGRVPWCRLILLHPLALLKSVLSTRFMACFAPVGEVFSTWLTRKEYDLEERQWVPARNICDPWLIGSFHRHHPEHPPRTKTPGGNTQQHNEGLSSGSKDSFIITCNRIVGLL